LKEESGHPERQNRHGTIGGYALKNLTQSISYTYTEPTVFFELVSETVRLARFPASAGDKGLLEI